MNRLTVELALSGTTRVPLAAFEDHPRVGQMVCVAADLTGETREARVAQIDFGASEAVLITLSKESR